MHESEIPSLPPTQMDLRQRTAWVRADGAKSGYARPVPLNDDVMSVVARRLPHAGKHIFTRLGSGGRISQIDARCLNRACRSVEITDFRFHDLRHTWASWHVQNGTPLMVLKELGGWETLEMVQRYAHLAPSHLASHASAVTFWS
jgi:integrase